MTFRLRPEDQEDTNKGWMDLGKGCRSPRGIFIVHGSVPAALTPGPQEIHSVHADAFSA